MGRPLPLWPYKRAFTIKTIILYNLHMCAGTRLRSSGIGNTLGALTIAAVLTSALAASAMAEPVVVAEGITPAHGAVAWSPDSTRLAYTGQRLTLYNAVGGAKSHVPVAHPFYITWLRNGSIAALFTEGGNTMLALVAPDGSGLSRAIMPPGTVSVHEQPFSTGLLIAQTQITVNPDGIETHHRLHVLMPDSSISERFSITHINDRKTLGLPGSLAARQGWLPSGPGPLGGRMLLLEHMSPLDRNPYMKLSVVDPASGGKEDLLRASSETLPMEGSWSPGGRAIALANSDGRLRILSMDGTLSAVEESLKGSSPAWSPAGSQIFFGGSIVSADGSGKKALLPNGPNKPSALGFWRPDGTGIAVLRQDGTLLLLEGVATPVALPADAPPSPGLHAKLRLLADLLEDGLISTEDYSQRVARIRKAPETGQ